MINRVLPPLICGGEKFKPIQAAVLFSAKPKPQWLHVILFVGSVKFKIALIRFTVFKVWCCFKVVQSGSPYSPKLCGSRGSRAEENHGINLRERQETMHDLLLYCNSYAVVMRWWLFLTLVVQIISKWLWTCTEKLGFLVILWNENTEFRRAMEIRCKMCGFKWRWLALEQKRGCLIEHVLGLI